MTLPQGKTVARPGVKAELAQSTAAEKALPGSRIAS